MASHERGASDDAIISRSYAERTTPWRPSVIWTQRTSKGEGPEKKLFALAGSTTTRFDLELLLLNRFAITRDCTHSRALVAVTQRQQSFPMPQLWANRCTGGALADAGKRSATIDVSVAAVACLGCGRIEAPP